MKIRILFQLILFTAVSALAHHGFSQFDMEKNVTYVGTVLEYRWENPHTHIILKVEPSAPDQPILGNWDIECQSIPIMFRQGWTKESYKPGDKITIVAHPMRNGIRGATIFYAIQSDGSRLYGDVARPKN